CFWYYSLLFFTQNNRGESMSQNQDGHSGTEYCLPDLRVLQLKCHLQAREPAKLSLFKGSMLRGALGHALRRTVCVQRQQQECEPCMLRPQCVYTRVFETYIEKEPPQFLRGLPTPPRPYIIDCNDVSRDFAAGDMLEFDMTLVGSAAQYYPYVLFAIDKAAQNGLGKNRSRFKLSVAAWCKNQNGSSEWRRLYDGDSAALVDRAQLQQVIQSPPLSSPLTLRFVTPTRIKIDNHLTMEFTFRQLAFHMLRRVLELAWFYQEDAGVDWYFQPLLQQADRVRIREKALTWVEQQRHSNRQQSNMKLGGFIGTLQLRGDLKPFSRLFTLAQSVHVGKGAVFGLGKIDFDP
ncbi:CRISPR system precrRNA processing endoribonuclease RAMP protein Cas6, partial [candidate division KSB1 bacterium]|nr:CRISPR system precrRNA processing endoribonuclease RAMP protein Cas6 [candidate division KSB1 bacterium]